MKILVCTDGSAGSRSILPHVSRLKRALGLEVVLARVLDPRVDAASEVAPNLGDAVAKVQAGWEDDLRSLLGAAGLEGEVMVPHRVWGKDIADAIHLAADETEAAMVALTSRGAGKVRRALFGSVTMGVIQRADLPVMTLANHEAPAAEGDGPYNLVITTDGSPDSRSIFEGMRHLLLPGKVKVTLLEIAVMQPKETEDEAIARELPGVQALLSRLPEGVEADARVDATPAHSDIAHCITEVAQELGADAIASSTHGHSARRHVIAGSVALGVVEKSGLPVILVKSAPVD